ncbi:MAG: hypothetical protein NTX59_07640 [Elusimicrobia bacterium]|nr:hypothetical protein [Elusimicrobiota bacterium]
MLKFTGVFILILAAPPLAAGAEVNASTAAYDSIPREVVIKSETDSEMRTKKPPLEIKTDELESIEKSLEPDTELFLFESGDFAGYSRNYPETISSFRVIKPWRTGFGDMPVITFYPGKKFKELFGRADSGRTSKEIQWTLSVTDEEGKIFQKYGGAGFPPETINWSGENDRHDWLKAGHSYAPVYVFVDGDGSSKTAIGERIKYTAMVFQKEGGTGIGLDSAVVFGSDKALKNIETPDGEAMLDAATDLVKRRYYGLPMKVSVYAQTKELADLQAELIRKYLKTGLMAAENIISCEGFADTFSQQRVDIMLANK